MMQSSVNIAFIQLVFQTMAKLFGRVGSLATLRVRQKRKQRDVFAYNKSFEQTLEIVSALRGEFTHGAAQFNR